MKSSSSPVRAHFVIPLLAALIAAACTPAPTASAPTPAAAPATPAPTAPRTLTVYSAREEALIGPIIEQFRQLSGIDVKVKYGTNPELVATIKEEGANSPADVFFATDPFQLSGLAGSLATLPREVMDLVPAAIRAPDGKWVSVTGRARVVVYNTTKLAESDLPATIDGYTDPKWRGRIGWPPTNGSFQAFLAAYRVSKGEDAAKRWVEGIKANQPKAYPNNMGLVEAVSKGEVEVGFTNHYYLFRFLQERGESFPARNHYFTNGDIGGLMLVNGLAVLSTSKNAETAHTFIRFMLSPVGQQYFASKTYEYPLIKGVVTNRLLPPMERFKLFEIDQLRLADTAGTLKLLRDTGVLP